MFCPECGNLLKPKKKDGEKVFYCSEHGVIEDVKSKVKQEGEKKDKVIEKSSESSRPVVEATCPDCGNKKAYYWTRQTRAADEPSTEFYKCTECGKTWRRYG